eukprot:scaffold21350_cov118-Isochrysis_galbana.AAC.5
MPKDWPTACDRFSQLSSPSRLSLACASVPYLPEHRWAGWEVSNGRAVRHREGRWCTELWYESIVGVTAREPVYGQQRVHDAIGRIGAEGARRVLRSGEGVKNA